MSLHKACEAAYALLRGAKDWTSFKAGWVAAKAHVPDADFVTAHKAFLETYAVGSVIPTTASYLFTAGWQARPPYLNWRPISEITGSEADYADKCILLCAPEFYDPIVNSTGVAQGYYHQGAWKSLDGLNSRVNPTHFAEVMGPQR